MSGKIFPLPLTLFDSARVTTRVLVVSVLSTIGLGCAPEITTGDFVWAINVAGPAYDAGDGTSFSAEASVTGGAIGEMPLVKGSQDPTLYNTYRSGVVTVAHALDNGAYDVLGANY